MRMTRTGVCQEVGLQSWRIVERVKDPSLLGNVFSVWIGANPQTPSQFWIAAEGGWAMRYRKLGNTGLIVSELALGTMQFGAKMNMGNLGQEAPPRMVKPALDLS